MASAALGKELECSVCLTLYTDPVTLRCGHNFCRVCIDQVLNAQDESGVYSCPECRAELAERPLLQRNISLCNVVENVRSTQPHQEKITGICCTYCIQSPVLAVRSCLMCEASLCDNHLQVHNKGAEHVLTEPSTNLGNRKCPYHKELLKYYCTKEDICICVSCCLIGKHIGHQLESLDEASEKKKGKLRHFLYLQSMERDEITKKVQSLEEHRKKAQEKASADTKRVTALFIDIRRRLDDLEKKVLSEISRQKEQVSLSLSDVIKKLEIKKDELSRKMRHIEELCNMTDPLTVLQDPDTGDLSYPNIFREDTGRHDGGDRGVEWVSHISHTLSDIIRDVNVTVYGQGPADILLDINTAANNVLISDDLKTMTWTHINQNRPNTAERFQYKQVISSSSFSSGRHYWDVDVSGSREWRVGMCYPNIYRTGENLYIGCNGKSWCLWGPEIYNNHCMMVHKRLIELNHHISSDRVRVCLDYEAGLLSFYELCDPIKHLYTFTATFIKPLHAALCVGEGYVKITGTGGWML